MVAGDFKGKHIDWGARPTITKGRELRKSIKEAGCNFHSTQKPTYWLTNKKEVPDLSDFFIS